MLKQRILTALVLLPLILGVILFAPLPWFLVFWGGVTLLAAWEWSGLLPSSSELLRPVFLLSVLALVYCASVFSFHRGSLMALSLLVSLWLWLAVLWYQCRGVSLGLRWAPLSFMVGLFCLTGFFHACVVLRHFSSARPFWLLYAFLIAWVGDSAAYFGGRYFGGRKLCQVVSPKKTWSGFFSGLIGALVLSLAVSFMVPMTWTQRGILWFLTGVVFVASVLGDLGVSLLKRLVQVKDTGNLLPGHGGVLDRLDSLIATTIVLAAGLLTLGV